MVTEAPARVELRETAVLGQEAHVRRVAAKAVLHAEERDARRMPVEDVRVMIVAMIAVLLFVKSFSRRFALISIRRMKPLKRW